MPANNLADQRALTGR